ncbi:hypothetical protein [Glacieibacterium frigidum]|uniref:Uncharacterized protein n=1 Tax=Glacieibacterium frigidum TaxID=2593303 RepID=A0A552U9N3_9SPHN|nr:hypothetical protein [Glacieibacterium frigidum]TRW14926.1 hypothetical protein FMM06_14790 [Glacieibacterium frigidum]
MHRIDAGTGLAPLTARLLMATIAVGLLHHIDHVLRVDHSGWPFRPDVTPFTFSLIAYPILIFALLGPARLYWLRWTGLVLGTALTLYAHAQIETPQMQYAMWAFNQSLEPRLWDVRNLCGIQSEAIGWVAVIVAMTLNVLLVASTIGMLANGVRRGR